MDLYELKSGTDIRGMAMGEDDRLTAETVKKLTAGFVSVLEKKTGVPPREMRVAVGHDCRLSSPGIRKAVVAQLLSCGVDVYDCALSSTPAMFLTTVKKGMTGSIQITASHLPYDKNGLKFFSSEGGFEGEDIDAVIAFAQTFDASPYCTRGVCRSVDYMSEYAHDLRVMIREGVGAEDFRHPLKGFSIAVDAGNGVGGFYAERVLAPLGADVSASRFLEPDGRFPNHAPNPEDRTAMASIAEAVRQNGCDLGVIFDTDVDRAACVDASGTEINRNRLVALAAAVVLEEEPGGTVVTDSVTSAGLTAFIRDSLGGVHRRFRRGYKNVINEALRLNREGVNCPLAIETSGHAALRENYFLDDGAYLVTKLIIRAARLRREGKTLGDLIAALEEPVEERELRLPLTDPDFRAQGARLLQKVERWGEQTDGVSVADDSCEGVKLTFSPENGNGQAILRLSVHEPVLPMNIESAESGGADKILARLKTVLDAEI